MDVRCIQCSGRLLKAFFFFASEDRISRGCIMEMSEEQEEGKTEDVD